MNNDIDHVYFFNNCHGRDHVALFGSDAFFDLGTTGRQGSQATDLRAGQDCVVLATSPGNQIEFSWYSFLRETNRPDENGDPNRVFYGKFITSECLDKVEVAGRARYAICFDRNGNIKQGSVFHGDLAVDVRPNREIPDFDIDETFPEGRESWGLHRKKERSQKAVARKKAAVYAAHGRLLCEVCDFDFASTYGVLGYRFAECHHRVPISQLKEQTRIRLSDLAIVCANCHRMLHRKPLHTAEELRKMVLARKA